MLTKNQRCGLGMGQTALLSLWVPEIAEIVVQQAKWLSCDVHCLRFIADLVSHMHIDDTALYLIRDMVPFKYVQSSLGDLVGKCCQGCRRRLCNLSKHTQLWALSMFDRLCVEAETCVCKSLCLRQGLASTCSWFALTSPPVQGRWSILVDVMLGCQTLTQMLVQASYGTLLASNIFWLLIACGCCVPVCSVTTDTLHWCTDDSSTWQQHHELYTCYTVSWP